MKVKEIRANIFCEDYDSFYRRKLAEKAFIKLYWWLFS